jgi:hypothetical protein
MTMESEGQAPLQPRQLFVRRVAEIHGIRISWRFVFHLWHGLIPAELVHGIMTDIGAYSDVVFGLFRLLGGEQHQAIRATCRAR